MLPGFWNAIRTSTGARQATAALRPHASASSRSAASSTQKPPMCSLVSRYGPSVMSTLPSGCARSDLAAGRGKASDENPDTGSHHFAVERVDLVGHRLGFDGRVVVVGVVNRNQILRHDFFFSCNGLRAGRLPCLHDIVERPDRNSTNRPRNFGRVTAATCATASMPGQAPAGRGREGSRGW
jgi:hypothetical protein